MDYSSESSSSETETGTSWWQSDLPRKEASTPVRLVLLVIVTVAGLRFVAWIYEQWEASRGAVHCN